jgi:UDP-glucose 4-epimerase
MKSRNIFPILVTGGAGYIGSHVVWTLREQGYPVVILDNLQQGHRKAIRGCKFVHADLLDQTQLDKIFKKYAFSAVVHLAGSIAVEEGVKNPHKYFKNNLVASINLVEAMINHQVNKLIFSSTAAVYAENYPKVRTGKSMDPVKNRLTENHPLGPTNPYGITKLMFEQLLAWYSRGHNLHYIALRYFNAAGAHPSGQIGEDHRPETHLIPLVLKTALGQKPHLKIFGTHYPTKDGTCVRDYIHVSDIAQAHILALKKILWDTEQVKKSNRQTVSRIYNLGNGQGFSVKEIIQTAQEITGRLVKTVLAPPRAGDQALLIADASRIKKELGWSPKYKTLSSIIESAWRWHKAHPRGFND